MRSAFQRNLYSTQLGTRVIRHIAPALLAVIVGCGPADTKKGVDEPTQSVVGLSISRYTSASLNDAEADTILQDASTILQTRDSSVDVSCPLRLTRDGAVGTFTSGTGVVDSESSFNAVCAEPGYVHVVNQIDWCGAFIPDVIGCASTPGDCMVVIRFTPAPPVQEGILWAHEYGHTKGLDHRDAADAVMRSFIGPTHRLLTAAESTAFLKSMQPLFSSTSPSLSDVRQFVRQDYIHGIPPDVASSFRSNANVEILTQMLSDSRESQYWSNVAVTLGLIGNERTLEPLVAFITRGTGTLAPEQYKAKSAAVVALGFLTRNLQGAARTRV